MTDEQKLDQLIKDIAATVIPEELTYYNLQYILVRGFSSIGMPGIESANKMIRILANAQLEDSKDNV